MLTWLSAWFHTTSITQTYDRRHYVILAAIIVVGVWLRFWGLGNVGLHGDEETMAMPALSLLETGKPLLPSGMFYSRALAQIYLMAGSVWIFGESEWALRFPSAVVGSLAVLLAFFLGRRFLSPSYNLAFVAIVALLPEFIEVSQTARMYGFWMTSLILFGVMIFRWERDSGFVNLALAVIAWLVALHFHQLSIFAVLLFLYPGINRQSPRQLAAGTIAAGVGALAFYIYDEWISSKYPSSEDRAPDTIGESTVTLGPLEYLLSDYLWLVVAGSIIGLVLIAVGLRKVERPDAERVIAALLLISAYFASIFLNYHVGVILLAFGIVTWLRSGDNQQGWLIAIVAAFVLIAIGNAIGLYQVGAYPGRKLIGAMVGLPSVWPTLTFAEFSPAACGIYSIAFLAALHQLSRRKAVPDSFLFFGIAVWAQLFAIGLFRWYVPPRYVMGALPFFLLCYVACIPYLFKFVPALREIAARPYNTALVLVAVVALCVNPIALANVVNSGYESHPDHKGAAEFLQKIPVTESDVLVAEDVLQQTYYMGKVDYWLVNKEVARVYSVVKDGVQYDQYTHAVAIGTGEELERVLDEERTGNVYVIGSAESYEDERRYMRGYGINEVLNSERMEVVYVGRDGKTRVWRAKN